MNDTASTRLAPGRYLGYGLGDFAFNFYWFPAQLFLSFYYTDVLGLPSAAAGAITLICLVWDGVADPVIGIVANKTRSRWGRYRPYMLFGCVPLAASFTLMFMPLPFKDTPLIIYAFATQLVFRTLYSAVNIPYGAMMASMTRDSMERNWLAGVRMLCAMGGGAVVSYFTLQLAQHFTQTQSASSAYFFATAVLSSCATVVIFISFAATEERVEVEDSQTPASILALLKMLRGNTPFLQIMTANVLFSFGNILINMSLAYYVRYYMEQPADVTSKIAGLMPLMQLVAVGPWTVVSRFIGKRLAWIAGLGLALVPLMAMYFLDSHSPDVVYSCLVIYSFGAASMAVNLWSIVPDTVEYGEWRTGIRAEGFIFGFVTLIQKVGFGVTSAFLGVYLTAIGYVANQTQSAATLVGLKLLITLIAGGGLVASAIVMYFYRLDAKRHGELVQEIAARGAPRPA